MWVKQFKDGYQRMDYKYSISLLKKFVGLVRALGLLSIVDVLDGYNETIESEHNPLLVIIISIH